MKTITDLYHFRCITNLHAGSGDSNYGVVDKQVQRDPIDDMPMVNTSSLKGAFREQFEAASIDSGAVNEIFGTDSKANDTTDPSRGIQPKDWMAGKYFFYPAQLLFYPVRSSVRPFFYATSKALIEKYIASRADIGNADEAVLKTGFQTLLNLNPAKRTPKVFDNDATGAFIDEYQGENSVTPLTIASAIFPNGVTLKNLTLFHDDDMKDVCKRLPVIARNKLENGLSENLWYEEFVPRESWFYFFVSRPDGSNLFEDGLNSPEVNHKSQIGGDASVGYGLCKLQRIPA